LAFKTSVRVLSSSSLIGAKTFSKLEQKRPDGNARGIKD
jgi:hypothetical protein